jgi:signal transduction histidine kinase
VIDLYKEGENAIIKITDNGTGIPDEMVDKVFSPNFTTKSSGTGLGLAISTNMIQAFNGKIYFKTKVAEGTSFFVEIPLMRIKDNFTDQKIVSLDD